MRKQQVNNIEKFFKNEFLSEVKVQVDKVNLLR